MDKFRKSILPAACFLSYLFGSVFCPTFEAPCDAGTMSWSHDPIDASVKHAGSKIALDVALIWLKCMPLLMQP